MRHSVVYTLIFSAILCLVCAVMVSTSAVTLKDQQEFNKALDQRQNVLQAAGLIEADQTISPEEVDRFFEQAETVLVNLKTGEEVEGDTATYDQQKAKKNPATSYVPSSNPSRVLRLPNEALVYKFFDDAGGLKTLVLPIEGYGLWGTLYGYLALEGDLRTVTGLTYYDHKETPGLGGEVDNARWKALWPGRRVFDDTGAIEIEVIKGPAGPVAQDPHRIDGLAGATITSRGITNMLDFWLGEEGFGPYLAHLNSAKEAA